MGSSIGNVFREARNRRKVDLSEVEAATRIRARYLLAIENEEWDVLPGGVYTRGFIRTYASFLGLDGERLAEDYRKSIEGEQRGAAAESGPIAAPPAASPPRRRWAVPSGLLAVAGVIVVAVIAIVVIPGGGNGGNGGAQGPAHGEHGREVSRHRPAAPQPSGQGVSMRLTASAEVWVCVLDAKGQPLIDGQILEAGAEEGPFHSGSFTVSFGNGEVSMLIDGREAEIPVTSSPIGYTIDSAGKLTELGESGRPTCT